MLKGKVAIVTGSTSGIGLDMSKSGAMRRLVAATAEIALWMIFAAFVWIAVGTILSCLVG